MFTRIRRFPRKHPDITILIAVVVIFVLAQIFLGTRATPLESTEDFQARLVDGQPTMIEFYSNL